MTAGHEGGRGVAALETPGSPAAAPDDSGHLLLRLRTLCSACRQVLGIPDYERYLAHAAQLHPGAPVLTRGDFCAQAIDRKYGRGGARCC
jgi:uncharacterized short protein YbdD (DUF466 family)